MVYLGYPILIPTYPILTTVAGGLAHFEGILNDLSVVRNDLLNDLIILSLTALEILLYRSSSISAGLNSGSLGSSIAALSSSTVQLQDIPGIDQD